MTTVARWTGREARALRQARRLSVRAFAEHLGVAPTSVTNWEHRVERARLRTETQQLLDTDLIRLPAEVHDRFRKILDGAGHDGVEDSTARSEPCSDLEDDHNSARQTSQPEYPFSKEFLTSIDRLSAGDTTGSVAMGEAGYQQLVRDLAEWAHRMKRRDVLQWLSWAAAAAAAAPVLDELDYDERQCVLESFIAPERVDDAVVDHIEAVLWRCMRQDDSLGPQAALDTVLAQRRLVQALLRSTPPAVKDRLLSLYADLCGFAGWLSFDLGNYADAMGHYDTARAAAHEARNAALAALVLSNMSQTATWHGHARVGVDHAVAAQGWAAQSADLPLRAYTYDVAARAFALDGRSTSALDAIERARGILAASSDGDPTLVYFYNNGQLSSTESGCHLQLGDANRAEQAAEAALRAIRPGFVRNRAMAMLRLGMCRLHQGKPDVGGACQAVSKSAALATRNRSVRLARQLQAAWRELQPWHDVAEVRAVRTQFTSLGLLNDEALKSSKESRR